MVLLVRKKSGGTPKKFPCVLPTVSANESVNKQLKAMMQLNSSMPGKSNVIDNYHPTPHVILPGKKQGTASLIERANLLVFNLHSTSPGKWHDSAEAKKILKRNAEHQLDFSASVDSAIQFIQDAEKSSENEQSPIQKYLIKLSRTKALYLSSTDLLYVTKLRPEMLVTHAPRIEEEADDFADEAGY